MVRVRAAPPPPVCRTPVALGDELGWAAHAQRSVPVVTRRAACCPAPDGLGLRRSARETSARAARRVASPGVPNRRPRPWRSPGGCRRRPANGERAWARLSAPGTSARPGSAASPSSGLPSSPHGRRRLGLGLLGEIGSRRAFSSLNVTPWRVPTGFFFLSLHHVFLLRFLFPL